MINNDGEKGCLNQCIRMEETPRKKTGKHGEMSGVLEFKYCKEKGPIPTNCWKWVMFFSGEARNLSLSSICLAISAF